MPARVIGFAGTVLLHALLWQAVLYGTRTAKFRPPDLQGPGATLSKATAPPAATLILLELPHAPALSKPVSLELASAGALHPDELVALISPDALPHVVIPPDSDSDKSAALLANSDDSTARTLLFGRYTGQIDARIERAWRRPRVPIDADSETLPSTNPLPRTASPSEKVFSCQVQIVQDRQGVVREVQLLECDRNVVWRQSLITAIFSASPLPAAPNPAVFTQSLTMTFSAHQWSAAETADAYESATRPMSSLVNNPAGP